MGLDNAEAKTLSVTSWVLPVTPCRGYLRCYEPFLQIHLFKCIKYCSHEKCDGFISVWSNAVSDY